MLLSRKRPVNKKQKKRNEKRARQQSQEAGTTKTIDLREKEGSQIKETEESNTSGKKAATNEWISRFGQWSRRNSSPIVAAFTILLAVIAATQAFIYFRQLDVIRKDQRPWLRVTLDAPTATSTDNTLPVPTINLSNIGKTPAKAVYAKIYLEKVPSSLAQPQLNTEQIGGLTTGNMFPAESLDMTSAIRANPPRLSEQELSDFENAKIYFVLYSTVTYADIFGIKHWTKFCRFVASATHPGKFTASRCTDYNDTDNN